MDIALSELPSKQRAYLLNQLAQAPEGMLTASEAKKIPANIKKGLGLTPEEANRIREELEQEGKLETTKDGRSMRIAITSAGRELLEALKAFLPTPVPKKEPKPKKAEVSLEGPDRLLREAYILDAFARAANRRISKAELDLALGKKPTQKVLAERHPDVLPFRDQRYLKLNSSALLRGMIAILVASGDIVTVHPIPSDLALSV